MSAVDSGATVGAAAIAGFAVWQMYNAYQGAAPKLSVLRTANNDPVVLQSLVDADVTVGLMAVLAGGAASYLARDWSPLVIVAVAFATMSLYHHLILADCDD